jgi:hypothetical protein
MPIEPQAPSPPPRYHARLQLPGPDTLHPNTVTARLVVMSPAQWQRIEAFLKQEGFKPY